MVGPASQKASEIKKDVQLCQWKGLQFKMVGVVEPPMLTKHNPNLKRLK